MLGQINVKGMDKVETAVERLKLFEPPDGYYLAFSGGKDSVVIKALADMAGVRYDAHYSVTSVDPPELVQFIRGCHPDVIFECPRDRDGQRVTMWSLIPKKKVPPTRIARYCCGALKEGGGEGRFVATGVRWAESARRKSSRAGLELSDGTKTGRRICTDPDNPGNAKMAQFCPAKGRHVLNPIIDWEDADVWEFIHTYNVPYCGLYDQGCKRLGCIGCPMAASQAAELERYPKYKRAYLRAFGRMIEERGKAGLATEWETAEDVMEWWAGNKWPRE